LNVRGQVSRAVPLYRQATELDPGRFQVWLALGSALTTLGDHASALEAHTHATALNPESAVARSLRGRTLRHLDRADEALAAFERALALQPALVAIWYRKAELEVWRSATARVRLTMDLDHPPPPVPTWSQTREQAAADVASLEAADDHWSDPLDRWRRAFGVLVSAATGLDEYLPDSIVNAGMYIHLGDDPWYMSQIAEALVKLGEYELALGRAEPARARWQPTVEQWRAMARALFGLGRRAEAVAALAHALTLGMRLDEDEPANPNLEQVLERWHAREAGVVFARALALLPEDTALAICLAKGELLRTAHRHALALAAADRALALDSRRPEAWVLRRHALRGLWRGRRPDPAHRRP
jgi:tetratricopeptide (TPR) repeat protein